MAVIMIQEHQTIEKPFQNLEFVKQKSRKELSAFEKQQIPVERYWGPSNPPMPSEEAKCNIPPLSVFARVVISINRANDNDYRFF